MCGREIMKHKDYGIAWINHVKKPFIIDKLMQRGRNRGKLRIYLTRGRDIEGNILTGKRVYISRESIVECPGDLTFKLKGG